MADENFPAFLRKVLKREPAAVERFVKEIEEYVRRVAKLKLDEYPRARDMGDTEDIKQSVLAQLFRHADGHRWDYVQSDEQQRGLLRKMVADKVIDKLRRAILRRGSSGETPEPHANGIAPQVAVENADWVAHLLSRLTDRERWLILQRAVEERSYPNLANMTGHSPEALRVAYERLCRKIMKLFEEECGGT